VRHRWTKALYHAVGADGPVPVEVDQDQLERDGRVSVPARERDRKDWLLVDKEELKDFLPEDVRKAALPHILALFDEDTVTRKQAKRKMRKHKHDDNDYVLRHILVSKQTGHPMRGDSNTRRRVDGTRHRCRYYFDYSAASK